MRRIIILVFTLLVMISQPVAAQAAGNKSVLPVVHSVLFWSNGCPHCAQVLTQVLPPLQDKYNSQLSIVLIELVTLKDIDDLYALGSILGLTKEQVGVPFLLVGRTALVGADEISSRFSSMIEENLTAGGIAYPDLPQLIQMLPNGIQFTSFDPSVLRSSPAAGSTGVSGMLLAWVVMAIMGIGLILAVAAILRAFQGKSLPGLRSWMDYAIPVLSIIGLGASIYLTYIEISHSRALCGPVGDCNAVQASPYAKLFGIIPIGLLGAIGYIAILVAWLWPRLRSDSLARLAGPAAYAMALFGTLFSVYLTYLELFVIHAVCIWCLSSAVIITVLMLLNLPHLTQWLAISDEEE